MYQLVCFGVWDKREEAEEGSVLKLWPLFFLWTCPNTQEQPQPLAAPVPHHKQPKSLAAQSLAAGQGIVLVLGEGDDYTSGSSAASRGTQSPTNHGIKHDGGNKGGSGLQWEELGFLYPELCLATPKTVT